MRNFAIIIIFFTVSCAITFGIDAITTEGKAVTLNENGTWEYQKNAPASEDGYEFRKTNWGMSKNQVKATESAEIVKDDADVLAYKDRVAGLDTLAVYVFVNNQLVRSKYIFTQPHSNKNDYLNDYSKLQKNLIGKYGKQVRDEKFWKNDLYQDDYEDWGLAVSIGHLVMFSEWKNSETEIFLSLTGDNYKIDLSVEYSSTKLKSLEEAKSEQDAASQL